MIAYNGQAAQDAFVLSVTKSKRNGTYVEIGSNHPVEINNTFRLETIFGWKGIMVEYDPKWLPYYIEQRPNSFHVIQDATTIDYAAVFTAAALPLDIDYLQIDLEVTNKSTLVALQLLNAQVMDTYRFATVTFEHDIYRGDYFNTRAESRAIFESRGYIRVFSDVTNLNSAFEDWYVHPDLVDMEYVSKIQRPHSISYLDVIAILATATGTSKDPI